MSEQQRSKIVITLELNDTTSWGYQPSDHVARGVENALRDFVGHLNPTVRLFEVSDDPWDESTDQLLEALADIRDIILGSFSKTSPFYDKWLSRTVTTPIAIVDMVKDFVKVGDQIEAIYAAQRQMIVDAELGTEGDK